MIGTTLAHYRITAALGAGGMGEVWRATDEKLGREVALKVLPQEFAADPDRMARFEREARVLASLNHPNIAQLYGLETAVQPTHPAAGTAGPQSSQASPEAVVGHASRVPGGGVENSEFGIRNSEFSAVGSPRTDADADSDSGAGGNSKLETQNSKLTSDAAASEVTFLVMELVDGKDLSERIKRGPIPVDEAIPIALQMAEALEAAHEQGIVHRDLKPANIKITDDGTVKVLDFGLAKAWEAEGSDLSSSFSPTITRHATLEGVILGTAAYMSPEQARGKRVDRRADIWAFGVVLWEMLTGRKLFEGETVSDVMAAILTREPGLDALPAAIPIHVRALIGRCLRRDPKLRQRDMGDVRIVLAEGTPPAETGVGTAAATSGGSSRRVWLPWALAAIAAASAITLSSMILRPQTARADRAIDLALALPNGLSFPANELRPVVALSPAGDELVLVADDGSGKRIYRRSLSSPELVPVEGTEGGRSPFFSPDGRWVGFTSADSRIKKVSLDSGQVVSLADGDWGGGSWGEDGSIIFTPDYLDGLWRVPAAGGEAEELTRPDPSAGELNHSWPDHVPGTGAVIFTSFRLPLSESRVEVFDTATGERRLLVANAVYGRYLASGHLVFVRESAVHAAPFDRRTGTLAGEPVPVLKDAFVAPYEGNSQFSVSEDGTLVNAPASLLLPPREIVAIDRQGFEEVLLRADRRYSAPSVSPDGRSLAVTVDGADPDVWIYRMDRKILNRLTFSSRSEHSPIWYPDGRRIAFVLDAPPFHVYSVPADGSGDPVPVLESAVDSYPEAVLDGGGRMVVRQFFQGQDHNLCLLEVAGGEKVQSIRSSEFAEQFSTVSPDQRFIAYESDETGRREIYIQSFPEPGVRVQVTRDGGRAPLWADTSELFFWNGNQLFVTEIATSPELEIGEPEALFTVARHTSSTSREYEVTADGRRVLIVRVPEASRPREVRVVVNWFAELERLAGPGGAR